MCARRFSVYFMQWANEKMLQWQSSMWKDNDTYHRSGMSVEVMYVEKLNTWIKVCNLASLVVDVLRYVKQLLTF